MNPNQFDNLEEMDKFLVTFTYEDRIMNKQEI